MDHVKDAKKWLSEMHIILSEQTQKVAIDHVKNRIAIVEGLVDKIEMLENAYDRQAKVHDKLNKDYVKLREGTKCK